MANLPATRFANSILGLISILGGWTSFLLLGLAAWAIPCAAQETSEPEPTPVRQLTIANKPWTGDFDRLLERRMIRVLVPYSRTLYFNDKGRERGLTADLVREFEQYVPQKHRAGNRPVTVYLIPTTRDQLLQHVADGLGDIAAGNLTVTPTRQRLVDFVAQGHKVREVVVTGAEAAPVASLADLGGRTVHVRPSSSYHESLQALNERNRQARLPEVTLRLVPDALEDEDMMEMANAGLIEVLVVDDWKSEDVGADPAQDRRPRGRLRPRRRPGWLDDSQGQPAAGRRDRGLLDQLRQAAGVARLPARAGDEARQADAGPDSLGGLGAVRGGARAVPPLWRPLRVRSVHARRAGLPGIAARPGGAQPRRRHRRDAAHASDRRRDESG